MADDEIAQNAMVPGKRYVLGWDDCCTSGTIVGTFVGLTKNIVINPYKPDDRSFDTTETLMRFTEVTVDGSVQITEAELLTD